MSNVQYPPKAIANEESIARVVFSPLMVEDDEVSPSAFHLRDLRKPEDYVSVIRHDYLTPTLGNIPIRRAPQGNAIYGYALLNVGACRKIAYKDITIDVLSHSSCQNPYHAGIHFEKSCAAIKGRCMDPGFIVVASMLANISSLISF